MTDQQSKQSLDLPSPGSPSHLDEKILQYARERVPERRRYLQPVWVRSMAAASVVVVAVLLIYPQQLDRGPSPFEIEETVISESELFDDAPAAAAVRAPEQDADFDVNRAAAKKSIQAVESSFEQRARTSVSLQPKPKREPTAISADVQALAEKEVASDMLAGGVAPPPTPLDEQTIRGTLADIEALLLAGNTEQAEKDWLALQDRCPGCSLPATLEEAIALYLPGTEQ